MRMYTVHSHRARYTVMSRATRMMSGMDVLLVFPLIHRTVFTVYTEHTLV